MDWTITLGDASGLRPTASHAFIPISPTAIAAPSAAKPMCRLPLIVSLPFRRRHSIQHSRRLSCANSVCSRRRLSLVLTNQEREDGRQQHEDQRLDQAYKQLQEIKRDRQ